MLVARSCRECGTPIPWGAPQCVECGSYTHWRRRLATFGLLVGGGTVLVVVLSLARVWWGAPPQAVRATAEIQELFARLESSGQRHLVSGAGRCRSDVAEALCVQTTAEMEALREDEQRRLRQHIATLWGAIAEAGPRDVVFVDSAGRVDAN